MKAQFINENMNSKAELEIIESVTSELLSGAAEFSGVEKSYDLDLTTVEGYREFWMVIFYQRMSEDTALILKTLHEWELEGVILQPHEGFRLHNAPREMKELKAMIAKNSVEFPYVYDAQPSDNSVHPYHRDPPYISPVFSKIEFPNAEKITVLPNGIDIGQNTFVGG